jgi:hypothetical protein
MFGKNVVTPPPGSTSFTTDVPVTTAAGAIIARIVAWLDSNTGVLTWTFTSIDPSTGSVTTNPLAGFLPPDISPPGGLGGMLVTVSPKKGLATGTKIESSATITFDTNAAISTSTWLNSIDVTPPVSMVNPLPATSPMTFTVSWNGTDVGSGVGTYSVYVSDNGGPYTLWQAATTSTSASFTGAFNHTYGFYSRATDNVGNVESAHTKPDTTTKVTGGIILPPPIH